MFEPFTFEATGVFGPSTRTTVEDISRKIMAESNEPEESLWLKQSLGLAIVRGNAFSLVTTLKQDNSFI